MMNSSTGIAFRTDVILDYSITESERPGMQGGLEETAYGLFADFVSAMRRAHIPWIKAYMFKASNQNDCGPVVDPIDIIILVDQ